MNTIVLWLKELEDKALEADRAPAFSLKDVDEEKSKPVLSPYVHNFCDIEIEVIC